MKTSILMICVIIIIGIIYIVNKKRIDKAKKYTKGHDYIIQFQQDKNIDLKCENENTSIRDIQNYGEHGYRVKTLLTKEELEILLKEKYNLDDSDFTIIQPSQLYMPS